MASFSGLAFGGILFIPSLWLKILVISVLKNLRKYEWPIKYEKRDMFFFSWSIVLLLDGDELAMRTYKGNQIFYRNIWSWCRCEQLPWTVQITNSNTCASLDALTIAWKLSLAQNHIYNCSLLGVQCTNITEFGETSFQGEVA